MHRPLAIVTGASSGIGEEFAHALAIRGYDVVLCARRGERLNVLAATLRDRYNVEPYAVPADLATSAGVDILVDAVERLDRPVDLLVNNAGVGSYGPFASLPIVRELEMVDLNVRALVALTGRLLPSMIRRGKGGIIQIGSTASFQPVPYMATYAASKAFVLHFTEAVAREVEGMGVRVLAVCPGHTPTEFQACAGTSERPMRTTGQSAKEVVQQAMHAYDASEHFVVTGWPNRLLTKAARVLPRRMLTWAIGRGFKPKGT